MGIGYSEHVLGEWSEFTNGLRLQNRFHPTDESYISGLLQGALSRTVFLPAGTSLFRSRIMPLDRSSDENPLGAHEMGSPPPNVATGGRLNPDGIACLYAAIEEDTAVAEVRPWAAARLTIAEFRTRKDLDVLDLRPHYVQQNDIRDERQRFLSEVISRPVHREDRWGYLGTQYLAEALKARGVMGVVYESALRTKGQNVAIFSTVELDVVSVKLVAVRQVTYSYGSAGGSR